MKKILFFTFLFLWLMPGISFGQTDNRAPYYRIWGPALMGTEGYAAIGDTAHFSLQLPGGKALLIGRGDTSLIPHTIGGLLFQNSDSSFYYGNGVAWEKFQNFDSNSKHTVVFWGDSFTYGTGTTSRDSTMGADFSRITGWQNENNGYPGYTSTQILDSFLVHPETYSNPTVIWIGRNDAYPDSATTRANINQMIDSLRSDRYLIISIFTGADQPLGQIMQVYYAAFNAASAALYGKHFVNGLQYIINNYNPADSLDDTAFKYQYTPPSLRTNWAITGSQASDTLHLNNVGYHLMANLLAMTFPILFGSDTLVNTKVVTTHLIATDTSYFGNATFYGGPNPYLSFLYRGVNAGYIGEATTANQIVTGSIPGDLIQRSDYGLWGVSTNGGANLGLWMDSTQTSADGALHIGNLINGVNSRLLQTDANGKISATNDANNPVFNSVIANGIFLEGNISNFPYASSSWIKAPVSSGLFLLNNTATDYAGITPTGNFETNTTANFLSTVNLHNLSIGVSTTNPILVLTGNQIDSIPGNTYAPANAGTGYIQNQNTTAQPGAGFNTAGSGTLGGPLTDENVTGLVAWYQVNGVSHFDMDTSLTITSAWPAPAGAAGIVYVNSGSSTVVTITLPVLTQAQSAVNGRRTTGVFRIFNENTLAAVTVLPSYGTINGATSLSIPAGYSAKTFITDGTNWFAY